MRSDPQKSVFKSCSGGFSKICSTTTDKSTFQVAGSCRINVLGSWPSAVSYTHLDVYKRQYPKWTEVVTQIPNGRVKTENSFRSFNYICFNDATLFKE